MPVRQRNVVLECRVTGLDEFSPILGEFSPILGEFSPILDEFSPILGEFLTTASIGDRCYDF
jgi:hypothetical protein